MYEGGNPYNRTYRLQRPKQLRDELYDRMCDWGFHTRQELDKWMPDRQWIKAICDLVGLGYTFDSTPRYLRLRKRERGELLPVVVDILSRFLCPEGYETVKTASEKLVEVESEQPFELEQGEKPLVNDKMELDAEGKFEISITLMAGEMSAILAQRNAGKTYLGMVIAEEFLFSETYDIPWVWIDPMGVAWGLLADQVGDPIAKDVVLLGGKKGHRPLRPEQGKAVASAVLAMRPVSFVFDVSDWEVEQQHEFVADFLAELYRVNRQLMHVFIDEADRFAPQILSGFKHHKRCLAAMEDFARRGRTHGLGGTLITQRTASLHKSILSQAYQLFLLKSAAPHDLRAVASWFTSDVSQSQIDYCVAELPILPRGTAYYSSNGENYRFVKFKVKRRRTYDSSYSPPAQLKQSVMDALAQPEAKEVRLVSLRDEVAARLDSYLKLEDTPRAEDSEEDEQSE